MTEGSLDFRDREGRLDRLDGAAFDVLIIGAGITGAGIARDAAMRGLTVCLVEARDIASGTSSRSSKMIHGGLRYMSQGDLGLVHEAATERKAVERIAPHLARMTPFVIPAKNAAGIAKLRTGLWAFEKLGAVAKDRRHEVWSRHDLTAHEPALDTTETAGAVVYPEYLTNDSRLTLANVRAAAAHGAEVITYAPVEALILENGKAAGAVIGDALSSAMNRARIKARVVVNAAGPWVDAIRRLEDAGAPGRLQLTKGVHLVVKSGRLPVARTIIMPAADRRSVFAVPGGEVTYLGTTDTFYPEADVWPGVTAADTDYLLDAANRRFAVRPLSREDVIAVWSGVRPLVGEAGKSASEISRKDETWVGTAGVLSIAGGKLTAYRMMAERIVDKIEESLGRKVTASRTADTPLPGGDINFAAATAEFGTRRAGLYGAEAAAAGEDAASEAAFAVSHEGALKLEDYWVRRGARAWFDPDGGAEALAPAAASMAGMLGWSPQRTADEIAACQALAKSSLAGMEISA